MVQRKYTLLREKADSKAVMVRAYVNEAQEDCTSSKWTKEEATEYAIAGVGRDPSVRFHILKTALKIGVPINVAEVAD